MIGILFYNVIELLNYYFTYKVVMNISFAKKKSLYVYVLLVSSAIQIVAYCYGGDAWRDKIAAITGLMGAVLLTESKRGKTFLLFPIASFLPSLINVMASYGLAVMLGLTVTEVFDSVWLTCMAECAGILVLGLYGRMRRQKEKEEWSLSIGQYCLLLFGICGVFIVIGFSQGVLNGKWSLLYDNRTTLAGACLLVAFCFVFLSVWQQITQKRAYQYRMDNEKYELFLCNQEERIGRIITEDERKRKLRHDMNAHITAMDMMIAKEQWEELHQYFREIKKDLDEVEVRRYTNISAVDAIISEWHDKAMELSIEWTWEGKLLVAEKLTIFELCTLFSNLLSNAVEAVQRLPKDNKRQIQIKVANFQEQLVLFIGNSCERKLETKVRPRTSKGDEFYHGYGLKNVEDIVNKHGGSISYQGQDGWFGVEIVL